MPSTSPRASLLTLCALASIAALTGGGCYLSRLASTEADMGRDAGVDALSDTGPPYDGITLEEYCAVVQDIACDVVERCACGPVAVENCRSAVWDEVCVGRAVDPRLALAIEEGRVIYDPFAAARFISHLREDPSACEAANAVGFTTGDAFTWGGVLMGTLAAGSPCTNVGHSFLLPGCRRGYCNGERGCVEVVGMVELCDGRTRICEDLDAPLGVHSHLRCAMGPGETTGICQALLETGSPCTDASECVSARCPRGVCLRPRPATVMCENDAQCRTNRCLIARTGGGTCISEGGTADGTACSTDADCVSMACMDGLCVPRLCRGYAMPAPTPAP